MVRLGTGIQLDRRTFTEKELTESLRLILTDEKWETYCIVLFLGSSTQLKNCQRFSLVIHILKKKNLSNGRNLPLKIAISIRFVELDIYHIVNTYDFPNLAFQP